MSEMSPAERAKLREEHRLIVQATMQAKRSGKLGHPTSNPGGDAIMAIGLVIVVLGLLILAVRYGN